MVCSLSLEGAICIGTNVIDEQTPLIVVYWGLHQNSAPNNLFWGAQKYAKVGFKCTLFASLFKFHIPVLCLTNMQCVGHPCGDKY